ncbi:MAG: acetyl-CoA sensor PanZ family protein [Moraxellaceae bacterium]|nr:acetyl-CoA sensor PanZ family protein [Moraxellaceae bacterium]
MPLEAIAINDFNTPLIKESTQTDELKNRLQKIYQEDKENHQFASGVEAIEYFQQAFVKNHQLYIGMFNDKPICAIGGFYQNKTINLEQLAMHRENKNRGIEEQFIKLIFITNKNNCYQISSNHPKIAEIIKKLKNN